MFELFTWSGGAIQLAISAAIANTRQLWHNWEHQVIEQYRVETTQLLHLARWAAARNRRHSENCQMVSTLWNVHMKIWLKRSATSMREAV
jgi:hypothetical protein